MAQHDQKTGFAPARRPVIAAPAEDRKVYRAAPEATERMNAARWALARARTTGDEAAIDLASDEMELAFTEYYASPAEDYVPGVTVADVVSEEDERLE